jgi:protein O-GlcNAc transferase
MRRSLPIVIVSVLVASVAMADWQAGLNAYNAKDYPTAVREFQAVVQQNPEYAGGHQMLGLTYRAMGRNEDALKSFQETLRLQAGNPSAAAGAAGILLERNRAQEAVKTLETVNVASLKGAQRTAIQLLKAQARLALNDAAGAADLARQVTQAEPRNGQAFGLLGVASSRMDRSGDAFAAYRKAWELTGDASYANSAIAEGMRTARSSRNDQQKRQAYSDVAAVATQLAERKGGPEGALAAGEALMGAKQYDQALQWFDRSGLDNALVEYYRGMSHQGKGDLARAENLFRRALQKGPDARLRRNVYASLGYVLAAQKRFAEAAQAYTDAGDVAKANEMRENLAKQAQNEKADEEKRRYEEAKKLQEEYNRLVKGGGPSPTPPPQ